MEALTPTRTPRILHVGPVPEVPDGGIAAYLLGLLRSPLADAYRLETLDVSVPAWFRRHRATRPALSARFAAALAARLALQRPDLVHVHTSDYGGFWEKAVLAAMARRAGCRTVLHLHGGSFDAFLTGLQGAAARRAARALAGATRVLVLSEAWRPIVAGCAPAARLEVHANAIDWAEFEPATHRTPHPIPRLLFLGMISQRKGLDELLKAVLELRTQYDFRLDVVGDEEFPGERARYTALYSAAGLADVVRFPGAAYGTAKLEFLRAADVFVLPSRSESFGISNLEAMASGLPVVSTRTGAIPEYLEDGTHGLLVAPGDAAGLAAALGKLLVDAPLRARLGAAARERARAYDWSAAAAKLAATYRDILGS